VQLLVLDQSISNRTEKNENTTKQQKTQIAKRKNREIDQNIMTPDIVGKISLKKTRTSRLSHFIPSPHHSPPSRGQFKFIQYTNKAVCAQQLGFIMARGVCAW
jgi:hypothetical protein